MRMWKSIPKINKYKRTTERESTDTSTVNLSEAFLSIEIAFRRNVGRHHSRFGPKWSKEDMMSHRRPPILLGHFGLFFLECFQQNCKCARESLRFVGPTATKIWLWRLWRLLITCYEFPSSFGESHHQATTSQRRCQPWDDLNWVYDSIV